MIPHFGKAIVEELFHRFRKIVKDEMSKKKCEYTNLSISLTKKENEDWKLGRDDIIV